MVIWERSRNEKPNGISVIMIKRLYLSQVRTRRPGNLEKDILLQRGIKYKTDGISHFMRS